MSKQTAIFIFFVLMITSASYWFYQNKTKLLQPTNTEQTFNVKTLTLKGSNTVGESFAPKLAEAYLKSLGAKLITTTQLESPVEKYVEGILAKKNIKIKIDIRAHGSSTGFKALNEQSTQIAMSSRAIKLNELNTISTKIGAVNEHPIALDALAIVTYPTNPINQLTIEQIAKIFSGEITNWNEIGGNDLPISLFSRDNQSGTWDTFKSLVLKPFDKKLAQSSYRFESSNELVNRVTSTPGSLGFVGVAYVNESKLLKVSANNTETGSKPSGYTIGTQKYPLSRKLYFYTTGSEQADIAKDFIRFVTHNDGQKLAEHVGLISYYPTHYQPQALEKDITDRYRELSAIGRRITVNFASIDTNADQAKEQRDIQRLKNYLKQNTHKKIVLVDFNQSSRIEKLAQDLSINQINVLDTLQIPELAHTKDSIEVWAL